MTDPDDWTCRHEPTVRQAGTVMRNSSGVCLVDQGFEGAPIVVASHVLDGKRDLVLYACRHCGAVYSQIVEAP